ncbi:MAG: hypothetical protein JWO02_4023 [Solirubrobacterales bacterium]|nr:hypothetical protein [Solirubrobacterales bacterium]
MNIARSLRGKALASALSVVALMGVALVVLLSQSSPAPADVNLNNMDCHGHTEKAPAAEDDPGATQVRYFFACNGPITGYQVQPNLEVQSMETEVFGIDRKTNTPYPNDSFSCSGDLPGFGINCVGFAGFTDNAKRTFDTSQKSYVLISGTFSIDGDICAEPRVDPLLTVMTAGINSAGVPTQAISGPYDMGRPVKTGCKLTRNAAKRRIPDTGADTDASNSDVGRR